MKSRTLCLRPLLLQGIYEQELLVSFQNWRSQGLKEESEGAGGVERGGKVQ